MTRFDNPDWQGVDLDPALDWFAVPVTNPTP
jgi:hypothetical protein